MNYEKEIEWLKSKGITSKNFKGDDHDRFTIGVLAKRLHEYATEVNGADTGNGKCHIQNVSVSLLNLIQLQADIYTEREAKAHESAAHREAYENNIKANTVEQILLMIKSNAR